MWLRERQKCLAHPAHALLLSPKALPCSNYDIFIAVRLRKTTDNVKSSIPLPLLALVCAMPKYVTSYSRQIAHGNQKIWNHVPLSPLQHLYSLQAIQCKPFSTSKWPNWKVQTPHSFLLWVFLTNHSHSHRFIFFEVSKYFLNAFNSTSINFVPTRRNYKEFFISFEIQV